MVVTDDAGRSLAEHATSRCTTRSGRSDDGLRRRSNPRSFHHAFATDVSNGLTLRSLGFANSTSPGDPQPEPLADGDWLPRGAGRRGRGAVC